MRAALGQPGAWPLRWGALGQRRPRAVQDKLHVSSVLAPGVQRGHGALVRGQESLCVSPFLNQSVAPSAPYGQRIHTLRLRAMETDYFFLHITDLCSMSFHEGENISMLYMHLGFVVTNLVKQVVKISEDQGL